jgi:hypothetical protein
MCRLGYEEPKYLRAVAGPHNEYRERSLRRVRERPPWYVSWGQSPQFEVQTQTGCGPRILKNTSSGRDSAYSLFQSGSAARL